MTSDAAIRSLKSEISGQVLTPVDGGFDAARGVQHHDARKDYARPSAKFERLSLLKLKYDPHNVFRMNQNVTPAV